MLRFASALVALLWSALASAQATPTVGQWIAVFEEVRQHALFSSLNVVYAKAPAANIGYTPVGVIQRSGVDCVVVISEGDNPKMTQMMALAGTSATTHAFMQTVAAHEFGHCFRMRSKHLSIEMWERVEAATPDSQERLALEKLLSIEEAYADAYAFVYLQATHPDLFADVLQAMHTLRHVPAFATPFYQVEPLYEQLSRRGLNVALSLHDQVEAVMVQAKFSP
ncbi:MAG: hypothetical protein V4858_07925 [Pseudomonadota bacterium]